MTIAYALCFPGQGSQIPGMHEGVVSSPLTTSLLDAAYHYGLDLLPLLQGSQETLMDTAIAQPALYLVETVLGKACMEAAPHDWQLVGMAGHSVGEYAAACTAEAFTPVEGMKLVVERGKAMSMMEEGTMASVIGLEGSLVQILCDAISQEHGPLSIAGYNAPGQLVVSGTTAAIEAFKLQASAAGAKRVIQLSVGGAFHSALMKNAAAAFSAQIMDAPMQNTSIPVVQNVDAGFHTHRSDIRSGLIQQIESPVRWQQSVLALKEAGVQVFIECGPGTVLSGLIHRIDPQLSTVSVHSLEDVTTVFETAGEAIHG